MSSSNLPLDMEILELNREVELLGVDSSLRNQTTSVDHCEISPHVYEKYVEKKKKCMSTNCMLKNGLIYLYYVVELNVIVVSITYTRHKS